jgi:renalase
MRQKRIAVIGAGMAGLACARELEMASAEVTVFEKSRGLGGRLATRRQDNLAFDHGAQFVAARGRPFAKYMDSVLRSGCSAAWRPPVAEDARRWDAPLEDWQVGIPGMSALVSPLGRSLKIRRGTKVQEIIPGRNGWLMITDAGREGQSFDAVAVAVPAPQALSLLAPHAPAFRQLTSVRMAPCWSVMVRFDTPPPTPDGVHRWTGGALSWAACDSSKPGRAGDGRSWVLHAGPDWSREYLEADAQEAARLLLREFSVKLGAALAPPTFLQAHRWRYAQVEQALGLPCIVDSDIAVGACGDWCVAPRVEAAFDSGRSLAHSLQSALGLATPLLRR